MSSLCSDGVFVENESGFVSFVRTPAPSLEEIRHITEKIARRMHKWLKKRLEDVDDQDYGAKEPLLSACYSASIRYLTALGQRAGQSLLRVIDGLAKERRNGRHGR